MVPMAPVSRRLDKLRILDNLRMGIHILIHIMYNIHVLNVMHISQGVMVFQCRIHQYVGGNQSRRATPYDNTCSVEGDICNVLV